MNEKKVRSDFVTIIHAFITILLCNTSVLLNNLHVSLPRRTMQTYLYFLCVSMDLLFAYSNPMRHTNTEFQYLRL